MEVSHQLVLLLFVLLLGQQTLVSAELELGEMEFQIRLNDTRSEHLGHR